MSQYNSQRSSGTGRSRARTGSSRSQSSGSGRGRSTGTRSSGSSSSGSRYYSSSGSRRSQSGKRRGSSGRRGGGGNGSFGKIAIGGVVLIIAIACIAFLVKGMNGRGSGQETETEITTPAETELQKEVSVDGIDITGLSREDARAAILKDFPWAMKVTWEDRSYDVTDLMAEKVDALLSEIYSGEPQESYSLDTSGLEDAAKAEAASVAAQWDKSAKNGSISSYDAENDRFIFAGAEAGLSVDQEKLASDILSALDRKEFDAVITASVSTVEPEYSEEAARQRYEKIGTFTTKTTANAKRNTNVRLAAEAINGTVVQPGEEFSFNETVGQRTEAKGYKGAAAYNNGEVVEEIGGGVCQVSSTLYNAVVKSGLKTTVRRSHTYEPSYVTPGTDATISWGGPDYKFVNNSSAGIGIRASYADQTMTVSIYGIPILEEGVTYSLESTKVKDLDPPAPTYEEDPTLEPGVEKTKSSGSIGSQWETRLVVKKNGEVVSRDVDHTVTYKGHAPVILRNTSGTVAETLPGDENGETIDPGMSSIAPEGAGDGLTPGDTEGVSAAPGGNGTSQVPGGSTTPETGEGAAPTTAANPAPQTAAPSTTTAPTTAAAAPTTAAAAPTPAETTVSAAPGGGQGPVAAPGSGTEQTISPGP